MRSKQENEREPPCTLGRYGTSVEKMYHFVYMLQSSTLWPSLQLKIRSLLKSVWQDRMVSLKNSLIKGRVPSLPCI